MTTFSDYVTAYLPSKDLVAWTNPKEGSYTTVDTTRLLVACSKVEDEFSAYIGAFDDSDTAHLNIGVDGVVAHLMILADPASQASSEARDKYIQRLRALAKTTHLNYVSPTVDTDAATRMPRSAGRWVRPHRPR